MFSPRYIWVVICEVYLGLISSGRKIYYQAILSVLQIGKNEANSPEET